MFEETGAMQQEKKQMGVVGERDAVLAFKALGMRVIAVSTPEETTKALHRLYSEGIPVIFLTETCAQQVPETRSAPSSRFRAAAVRTASA